MRLWKPSVWVFSILALAVQAQALSITPSSGALNISRWEGNQTSNAQVLSAIAGFIGSATELYKSNVGGPEEKPLAGSYETTFSNSPTDPSDALIDYISGTSVGPTAYLLVKDGNQSPAWYLFDLTALAWNGTADLDLSGFWPNQGAISHVSLFGSSVPVPEPATMLLLGAGLIGLAGYGRKRLN
jgi:hypothetical protein